MRQLLKNIASLDPRIERRIDKQMRSLAAMQKKNADAWFSELCFCILTSNSRMRTAMAIQQELGPIGFLTYSQHKLTSCIRRNRHRFHNTKAKYIVEARKHKDIKQRIKYIIKQKGLHDARLWIADNIKGIGMKEASHFLRNVGYFDVAILDRHILRTMQEQRMIAAIPKSLTRKNYIDYERDFLKLAKKTNLNAAKLDYILWYFKTEDIGK